MTQAQQVCICFVAQKSRNCQVLWQPPSKSETPELKQHLSGMQPQSKTLQACCMALVKSHSFQATVCCFARRPLIRMAATALAASGTVQVRVRLLYVSELIAAMHGGRLVPVRSGPP